MKKGNFRLTCAAQKRRCLSSLNYCWSRKSVRVLSWIYRLGEKSRVAEGHELPSGIRGHASPEIVWNEYALRCNLVHFKTQLWEMLQWYFISFFSRHHGLCHIVPLDREYLLHVHSPRRVWMIFPIQLPIYCNDNNIFGGGGGKLQPTPQIP